MNEKTPPELVDFLAAPIFARFRHLSAAELYAATADLPIKMIRTQAGPYLERYFLLEQNNCFGYLHRFVNKDARDEGVHDHPWDMAFSQVLHGGYIQQVNAEPVKEKQPVKLVQQHLQTGDSNTIAGTRFHKIIDVQAETWTLFVHTAWTRPWGFLHGDVDSSEHYYEVHVSDPDARWWPNAPLAKDSQRQPFFDAKLVA